MANRGIYPALSGAIAETRALETVASNLANASSGAFRAQRTSFRETLARVQGGGGRGDLRYVKAAEPVTDTGPGPVRFTGVATDVALSGPGFLTVKGPGGVRYVRGGPLTRAADGGVVTNQGFPLLGADGQPVRLPPGELAIGRRGELYVSGVKKAQLQLVEFTKPQSLRVEGAGLFAAPAADPARPATATEVLSQNLEGANINPLRAMTEVLITSRHYEALHRIIETYREVDTSAARDLAAMT